VDCSLLRVIAFEADRARGLRGSACRTDVAGGEQNGWRTAVRRFQGQA